MINCRFIHLFTVDMANCRSECTVFLGNLANKAVTKNGLNCELLHVVLVAEEKEYGTLGFVANCGCTI